MPIMIDIESDGLYLKGISQGISQGIRQGITQGISQGINQGINLGLQKVAIEGYRKGLSTGMLSSITGLSELEIKDILKENNLEK